MGLYERIKEVASAKGTTINRIEKELNLPRSSISKYNTNVPSIDRVKMIADYLKVPVDYLLDESAEDMPVPYYVNDEAREMVSEIFNRPELKILFNSSRNAKRDQVLFAAEMLDRMKGTNPDG